MGFFAFTVTARFADPRKTKIFATVIARDAAHARRIFLRRFKAYKTSINIPEKYQSNHIVSVKEKKIFAGRVGEMMLTSDSLPGEAVKLDLPL